MKTNPKLAVVRLLSRAAAKGDTVWVEDGFKHTGSISVSKAIPLRSRPAGRSRRFSVSCSWLNDNGHV